MVKEKVSPLRISEISEQDPLLPEGNDEESSKKKKKR
jgi:hypothetical protein